MPEPAAQPASSLDLPRYCRGCGYNLHGLPSRPQPRCPECGRAFDPADPRSTLRRPPRRWSRWVWRAGFAALALVLLLAAVWGWFYLGWYEEQQALLRLRAVEHEEQPLMPWLQRRLGSAGFVLDRVEFVRLEDRTDPGDLGELTRLTRLESLVLIGTPVRDLRPLARLPELWDLALVDTPVTDLRPLGDGPRLFRLYMGSSVRPDLTPLARCKSLRQLTLVPPTATDAEVETLQRALPDCKIERQ